MRKFKNDKERITFLEDYRNQDNGWYLWKHDQELERSFWRFDLDECALIVEEELSTIAWPSIHEKWIVSRWYVVKNWNRPFADARASRTLALAALKETEKK